MTSKELLNYLQVQDKGLNLGQVKVLVRSANHSFRVARGEVVTVEKLNGSYYERDDDSAGEKLPALVID